MEVEEARIKEFRTLFRHVEFAKVLLDPTIFEVRIEWLGLP